MISLASLKFDLDTYDRYVKLVEKHEGVNPGCKLHEIWKGATENGIKQIRSKDGSFTSADWVGSGFPAKRGNVHVVDDYLGFYGKFLEPECLDIHTAGYEFYSSWSAADKPTHPRILDIGSGYGRLAIAYMAMLDEVDYIGVDYSPFGLWGAPQAVYNLIPDSSVGTAFNQTYSRPPGKKNFVSVGAWNIESIDSDQFDLALSIHSIQEMERDTVEFYFREVARMLTDRGVYYFLNQKPTYGESLADYKFSECGLRILSSRTIDRLGQKTYEVVLSRS